MGLYYKTFYCSNFYHNLIRVLATISYLHSSQIFRGKAGSQPLELSPVSFSLAAKFQTWVKATDSGKHSSF